MIDKIFDNFEILYENYMDMPETQKERNNIFKHMEEKGIDIIEIEQDISTLSGIKHPPIIFYSILIIINYIL